jgi:hypothetical protein
MSSPMLLSLVLIHADLDDRHIAALYHQAGFLDCEVVGEPVPGIAVLGVVEDARSERPECEFLRHCRDGGWTVLADETGTLALERRELWTALAKGLRTKVLVLHAEPGPEGITAFALHHADGRRRALAVCEGERQESGEPLAIEGLFAGREPSLDDLITLAQSLGIDFERLNVLPPYTVMAARAVA